MTRPRQDLASVLSDARQIAAKTDTYADGSIDASARQVAVLADVVDRLAGLVAILAAIQPTNDAAKGAQDQKDHPVLVALNARRGEIVAQRSAEPVDSRAWQDRELELDEIRRAIHLATAALGAMTNNPAESPVLVALYTHLAETDKRHHAAMANADRLETLARDIEADEIRRCIAIARKALGES